MKQSSLFSSINPSLLQQGIATGPLSRILSFISLFFVIYLMTLFLKEERYILLGILVIFGFTRVGFYILIGILIYLLSLQHWHGVIVIFLYLIIGYLSLYAGAKNINKELTKDHVLIDPMEGMHDFSFLGCLIYICFALGMITKSWISLIAWILLAIFLFFLIMRLWYRLHPAWKRIYLPLMYRYASLAGKYMGIAENKGEEDFKIQDALFELVQTIYVDMDEQDQNNIIDLAKKKMLKFTDRENLFNYIIQRNPNFAADQLNKILDEIEDTLNKTEAQDVYLIRYFMAEIIERELGDIERSKFLFSLFNKGGI